MSGYLQGLRQAFLKWSLRRSPRIQQLTLSQRRIYIMPSRAGFAFMLLLAVLLLLAINYQNNLIFALTFLLSSLFVVVILHTYANLSGLTISFLRGYPCYAGEQAGFDLQLSSSRNRAYESIQLRWQQGQSSVVDLLPGREQRLRLYQPAPVRGWLTPGPLLVETFYPLGLFRAWTWVQADIHCLVYPKPIAGGQLPEGGVSGSSGATGEQDGNEEFAGLEQFQPGMSLKRVAWKQYARGQGMHAKSYVELQDEQRWLSWQYWPELDQETRLSRMTWWVLQLDRLGQPYGLLLPTTEIAPDTGEQHRTRALEALAGFARKHPVSGATGEQ